jgi:hypothetical protein
MKKNAYPEKPILQYKKTTVEMGAVITYLKSLAIPVAVKRAVYVFFRNESGNGAKGLNNNYAGIQADGGRWPAEFDNKIAGTVIKTENKTAKVRIFVAFNSWQDSIDFTVSNALRRGLFVGGETFRITKMKVATPADLCTAYKREWVKGLDKVNPGEQELKDFLSMYHQAEKIFA